MSNIKDFDHYLTNDGASALVICQHLIPVEGADGVVFPSTYAAGENFGGGYNIDGDPNGTNVCLIDSVGSQANRLEPLFKENKYKELIPQIVITAGTRHVNLLEAGHRAGDAIVRCTEIQKEVQEAFTSVLNGDAEPLARIAPTSLVFGVWDSRDTHVKLPRLITSTIRAYNVRKLTRHAQYIPAVDYVSEGLLEEPADLKDAQGRVKGKHPFAIRGFTHVPVSKPENIHGGVIAEGGIRRTATLGLAALRLLHAGGDERKTLTLRRYVLGLALTAFTYQPASYLRQGCLLVLDPDPKTPHRFDEVLPTGERKAFKVTHAQALEYATAAAAEFGIGEGKTVTFDVERAKKDLLGEGDTKTKAKKATKAK